jgi:hypothetical protein
MLFCRYYFSPLNTFMRKGKDPDSYSCLSDPDPGVPKTCGSCGSASDSGSRSPTLPELKKNELNTIVYSPFSKLQHKKANNRFTYLQIDGLASVDDAVGDGGAVDDAAEHVHENGLHLHVLGDDAEGLLHLNPRSIIRPDH